MTIEELHMRLKQLNERITDHQTAIKLSSSWRDDRKYRRLIRAIDAEKTLVLDKLTALVINHETRLEGLWK